MFFIPFCRKTQKKFLTPTRALPWTSCGLTAPDAPEYFLYYALKDMLKHIKFFTTVSNKDWKTDHCSGIMIEMIFLLRKKTGVTHFFYKNKVVFSNI